MELLAIIATVYCAGFTVSAATWMFLCSVVWFLVTVTVGEAHSLASSAMMRSASKSLERMRTEPFSMPHSACAAPAVPRAKTAAASTVEASNFLFMVPILFFRRFAPAYDSLAGSHSRRHTDLPTRLAIVCKN